MIFHGVGVLFAIMFSMGALPDATAAMGFTGADGPVARRAWATGQEQHQLEAPGAPPLLLNHGTTTVAMVINGGVIAAVDSRASMGGQYQSCSASSTVHSRIYKHNFLLISP
jgi:hypothetical protein